REQQLSDIFENTSDLIQSASPDGNLIFVNRAWRERLGYSDADLVGRSFFEFVAPDCQKFIRSKFRLILAGQAVEMFDVSLVAENGERVLVECQITARFEGDLPVATRGIFRDVTERRHAEEALRESKAQLNRVLEGSQQCFWDWNITTNQVIYSGRWFDMLGHRRHVLNADFSTWENLLHPEDRPAALAALHEHIAGKLPNYEIEHRMQTESGEWKWILTRGLVVNRDREGKAIHLAGTHTDIHARKLAEESLRQRERQLRQISDNFPEGTLYQYNRSASGNARFTFIGGGFDRLFGTDAEALMTDASWLENHLLPQYLPAMKEAGRVSQRDQTPFRQDVRIHTVTGAEKWLSFRSQPRRTDDGDTIWDGVIVDVTLNKEAEATIAQQVAFFSALNETTLDLLNRREKSHLLQAIVERTATLIDAPHIELSLLEGAELATVAYAGSMPDILGERVTRTEAPLSWRALDERRPVVVDNYSMIPEARAIYRDRKSQAAAVFPILHGDEVLGVLGLLRLSDAPAFTAEDQQKGKLLAQLVALVLHNSEIYEDAVHEAAYRMRALGESERRLREAQRLAHVGHWEFRFTSGKRFERWSDETYRIFGLEPQSVVIDRARFESLIYPPDLPVVRATVDKAFAEFIPFALNYRLIRPDGEMREVRDQGEPKLSPTGEVIGMHGVMQDVTERTAALAALREGEERNRQIIDTAFDAVVTMDQQGRITGWNPQAEAIFGWDAEAAIGQTVTETFLPTTLATKANVALNELFSTGKGELFNRRQELRALHRNGRELPVELSIAPVTINGRPHFSAFLRDITTQRQTETHLRQAQKMESLGTLSGGIAHDFNNLLTGMFGFMELARRELATDHPARFSLDKIAEAAGRAKNLVQQILTFSRQNEGERVPVDPTMVVAEALQLLRSTIPPMVRIEHHIAKNCPRVLADTNQLHQVVMNLGTNAWQALPEQGGVITVRVDAVVVTDESHPLRPDIPRGSAVCLTVTDNGCGMNPKTLERVFDPFFTTKSAGKGTGLGLAVVHGVVRAHGGAVAVHSTPGEGTRFEIFLPTTEVASTDEPPPEEIARGRGQQILLVDDETMGRVAIAKLLQIIGYRVEHFEHPDSAFVRFAAQPLAYDLVITDFAMPGVTGAEFSRRVRRIRPDLPVLVISGFLDAPRQQELDQIGVSGVLRKPPTTAQLAQAVAQCLPSAPTAS
ncbi:MAG: PAS domain S-box protein, partial [Candidatus Didemnitutus sp.]|nr:PAS domain S-box protein [Candidatus Didemnitutus sp.]